MVAVSQQLVGDQSRRTTPGTNPVLYITIHETANKGDTATAQAHANLLSRYWGHGSWHYTVDDIRAIQSYSDTARCWHAGDGLGSGNNSSIGIEICVNLDENDATQIKAYKNAAELVAMLMKRHNVPLSRVVQHNRWSGKNCPTKLRASDEMSWLGFLNAVRLAAGGKPITDIKPPKPSKPENNHGGGKLDVDGWWGRNVTTDLQSALGTPVDGEVWSQNVAWKSQNPALTSGWKWVDPEDCKGSTVIGALQKWAGVPKDERDKLIGPSTIKYVQRKLSKLKDKSGKAYYTGKIDGKLDKASLTVKGLQRALNDGAIKP